MKSSKRSFSFGLKWYAIIGCDLFFELSRWAPFIAGGGGRVKFGCRWYC